MKLSEVRFCGWRSYWDNKKNPYSDDTLEYTEWELGRKDADEMHEEYYKTTYGDMEESVT